MSTFTDHPLAPALRTPQTTRVEIARRGDATSSEAFIDRITRRRRSVHLELLLDDGRRAESSLDSFSLDWMDLRSGDIVPVHVAA